MTWVRVMKRDEAVEEDDAELAGEVVAVGVAEHARAVGDVDLAVEHRLDQALHLRGQVLAVGVEGDDDLGPRFDHQPVAGAQRRAAAAVGHVAGDRGAVLGGDVAGAVAGAVVDDQHLGRARRRPRPASGRARGRCSRPRCRRGRGSRSCRGSAPAAPPGGTPPRRAPRAPPRAGASCAPPARAPAGSAGRG